jgi:nicotinate-nucleotide adenylyltransferase
MKKVGLLGGTFDPVHNGHLQLGRSVLSLCGFDKVLFIPAACPPHKDDQDVGAIEHRLQMLKLAIGGTGSFEISEIEISRQKISYTIDTIEELKQTGDHHSSYYFIIGFDAISEIESWHRWQELLYSTNFIVAVRPGFSLKEIEHLLERNGFSPDRSVNDRWFCDRSANEILFLTNEIAAVSSTDVRARIAAGQSWQTLVPSAVADYIIEERLYVH